MQKESKEIDSVKLIALKFISSTPQLVQYCEAVTDLLGPSQVVSSPMGVLRVEQNATVANVPHCLHKPDPISVLKAERRNSNTESLKAHR